MSFKMFVEKFVDTIICAPTYYTYVLLRITIHKESFVSTGDTKTIVCAKLTEQ